MIEIVYDEEREKMREHERKRYELPKNIRQVGNAPGNYKIYIEDYVMTYLRKIAAPGNMTCRGAILLGHVYRQDSEKVLFISGAVDAQNMEFDISMINFNDSVWSNLYSEINKYFDDLVIVGWFLSRMGFSTNINEQMKKIHRENFPGDDKLLFLMDSLECDEAFYYYENGNLVREKGYYIYYVRNEKMQNYIISRKNDEVDAGRDTVLIKDKTVVETFREKERGRTNERKKGRSGLGRNIAGVGVVCAVSLGALWYISPSAVGDMRETMFGRNGGGEVQVFMNNSDNEKEGKNGLKSSVNGQKNTDESNAVNDVTLSNETMALPTNQGNVSDDMVPTSAEKSSGGDTVVPANDGLTTEGVTAVQSDEGQMVYTVEAGDTLVSIAIKMYGDQTKAEYIASVNSLDIDTPIYEGQKIVIPYIE